MFNYTRCSVGHQINKTIALCVFISFVMLCASDGAYGAPKTQSQKWSKDGKDSGSEQVYNKGRKTKKHDQQNVDYHEYIVAYPSGYTNYGKKPKSESKELEKEVSKSSPKNKFIQIEFGGHHPTHVKGNIKSKQVDKAYILGTGIGYIFNDKLRGNLEYNYFTKSRSDYFEESNNISAHWKLSSHMITTNAMMYLWSNKPLGLYAKAGVGMSRNQASKFSWGSGISRKYWNGKTNNNFAWQVGMGMSVYVSRDLETALEYMFIDRGTFKTKQGLFGINGIVPGEESSSIKARIKDHTIKFSIAKKF